MTLLRNYPQRGPGTTVSPIDIPEAVSLQSANLAHAMPSDGLDRERPAPVGSYRSVLAAGMTGKSQLPTFRAQRHLTQDPVSAMDGR
jgi:hypothetical protein